MCSNIPVYVDKERNRKPGGLKRDALFNPLKNKVDEIHLERYCQKLFIRFLVQLVHGDICYVENENKYVTWLLLEEETDVNVEAP